jgi:16S rRNA (uracil1498-N3)-methyltransferase
MGALHRFFIPVPDWNESALLLRGEEAHHCRNVLRHSKGDLIEVFQGRGISAVASIRELRKSEVELELVQVKQSEPFRVSVTLAQALPKGKHMDLVVQKATEIGVNRIVPLITERTVVRLDEEDKKREKWHRIALEACKQCGQNWLPELAPVETVSQFLASDLPEWCLVAALAPDAKRLRELKGDKPPEVRSLALAIGPEGDFSPSELGAFREAKFDFLSLGPNVLRSETAAIYALSVVSQEFF